MKKRRLFRKFSSILLVISLLFSMQTVSFGEAFGAFQDAGKDEAQKIPFNDSHSEQARSEQAPSDTIGHWAEKQLVDWWSGGRLQGYADGGLKPDLPITRGEFMAIVNRVFGFTEKAPVSFNDLGPSDWEYSEVAKALYAGYIEGYADSTMGVKRQISRQEAAVIIARLMKLEEQDSEKLLFSDAEAIAAWSRSAVAAVVGKKWMEGYGDASYRPAASITRAEAVVTVDRALGSGLPIVYEKAGTYGPETGVQAVSGDIIVRASGVTLRNMKIGGGLLLDEAIGEGEAWLKNVKVSGTTEIKGGGANSVHFENSTLADTVVNKKSGSIRIVAEGSTVVATITVRSSAILEHSGTDGAGFEKVVLSDELLQGFRVQFIGDFELVDIFAKGIKVELSSGTFKQITVREGASGIDLLINKEANVLSLMIYAVIQLLGQGVIEHVTLSEKGNGTTFETQPKKRTDVKSGAASSSGQGTDSTTAPTATPSPTSTSTPSPTVQPSEPPTGEDLTLIENGQAKAVVLIPSNDNQKARSAADTLAEYVSKSTGIALPVSTEAEFLSSAGNDGQTVKIYVGAAGADSNPDFAGQLNGLALDGFVISPYGNSITIAGPTALGTEFGVYEFLERYVGVRWLMPGELGEDVPELSLLTVPGTVIREEPAIISRDVVGFMGYHTREADAEISRIQLDWATKNRNNSAINFHHNLYRLFPPSEYLESHPEFFPHKNGKPYIPALNMGWQPCFSAEGIVEEAVKNIIAYFDENPDKISYSLGMIDGNAEGAGFCEKAERKNSLGLDDMSNIYYEWVNKVAEGVLKVYPDKYFGLLAYAEVFDPPTNVKLNSHVIPNITDERYSWADPRREEEGKQFMEKWLQAASQIAWYDYIWGSPYVVPRIFNHQLAENLKYAGANGVVGYFAELYPNFGEGPKPWLTMKLLWNPNQDEDELVQEWYERAVGQEAAADLAAYYDLWEQFWSTRAFETEWYSTWYNSNPRYNFMPFNSATYLTDVTVEDIEESRRLLELVVQKAGTEKQKARAALLLRSFEYYEASALSYPIAGDREVPSDPAEALKLLEELIRREAKNPAAYALKRQQLINEFETDPILVHPIRGPEDQGMTWSGKSSTAYLLQWVSGEPENGVVRQYLHELVESEGESAAGQYAKYLLEFRGKKLQLNKNPSFEEADANSKVNSKSWGYWYSIEIPTLEEVAARTNIIARNGSFSIAAKGISLGSITQEVLVPEPIDFVSASAYYYTPPGTYSNGKVQLTLNLFDENWNPVGSLASSEKMVSSSSGEWAPVKLIAAIPDDIKNRVKIIQFLVGQRGFANGETVYIDDVTLDGVTGGKVAVAKASAENGRIVALLSDIPENEPAIGDFTVTQKLGNGEVTSLSPAAVSWNAASRTATVSVPAVAATDVIQAVTYTVQYRDTAPVTARTFTIAEASAIKMNSNASFEDFLAQSPIQAANWGYWYNNDNRTEDEAAYRTDSHARSGNFSIAAKGISLGSFLQEIHVTTPLDSISMSGYYFSEAGSGNGKIRYTMNLFNDKWENIGYLVSPFINASDITGEWLPIQFSETIPENVKNQVKTIQFMFEQREFAPGETVYIDDLSFYGNPDHRVSAVKAVSVNGSITVALSGEPAAALTADDFTVLQSIDGGEAAAIIPESIVWDSVSRTATLKVPAIEQAMGPRKAAYTVKYGHDSPIDAGAFTVLPINAQLLNKNVSFEDASEWGLIGSDYWGYWYNNDNRTEAETAYRTNSFARTGAYSIATEGISLGGITQDLQVNSPITTISATAYYYLPAGMTSGGKVTISMNLKDERNSEWIGSFRSAEVRVSDMGGAWVPIEFTAEIPLEIRDRLKFIQFVVQQDGFAAGQKIFIDDISVHGWNNSVE
ncbi:DUF4838 domain-containing protein [Paenibacillus eucommiae]|uniref:SLH domain-containing protein n=1 Tax=Paenibacillus eucommiae TaxID=1355755 RepID=A0ABS4IPY9_9BACL|nr:DUF4838 domain-containing protein [Paenibacillus eucommiae]MBP1989086.1 hypothetical protein [Paenibacillus eucommiae]